MTAAYRKYGKENFSYEPICSNIHSRPTLNFIEKFWIKVMDSRVPNGYNIEHGGSSKDKVSDETREKIRIANTGKKQPPEQIAKVVKALKSRPKELYEKVAEKTRGLKRSPEFCKKLGERSKGKVISAEMRAKLSAANKGKKLSEETKLKLSEAAKRQWARQKGEV